MHRLVIAFPEGLPVASVAFDYDQPSFVKFRNAHRESTRPLLVWIGSGLSQPAGLPGWSKLRYDLCEQLRKKVHTLEARDAATIEAKRQAAFYEVDLWRAFDILEETLGKTTFESLIRDALTAAPQVEVPSLYRALLSLNPSGLITLNIDRLLIRAFTQFRPDDQSISFTGSNAANFTHAITGRKTFLAELHGHYDDSTTWIFTRRALDILTRNEGFKTFITTCLITHTVLFVGITADDIAIDGHLNRLKSHGNSMAPHFWITDRSDLNTDQWAETHGLQVIRYPSGCHDLLEGMIAFLTGYVPRDDIPSLVAVPTAAPSSDLPSPEALERYEPEEIRNILNGFVVSLLTGSDDSYAAYQRFTDKYDAAIHKAWRVRIRPPNNTLLGYTLDSEINKGAFGRVYRAIAPDNSTMVAIKVLHDTVRDEPEMAQGFRRGVRSMQIISESGLTGVVKQISAAEIPACTIMELVEGASLAELVKSQKIKTWATVLRIAKDLCTTIHCSHQLPQRVLHRDIRPTNIMIRNGWTDPQDWEVVVLDFDLSWHRGATERSVSSPGDSSYLAPEQMDRQAGVSTRHTAVDSYGIGMTLFFLRTGITPRPSQHKDRDWHDMLRRASIDHPCKEWHSVADRFFRLVQYATLESQSKRLHTSKILAEVDDLYQCVTSRATPKAPDVLAEEIMKRAFDLPYEWDADANKGVVSFGGMTAEMSADVAADEIVFVVSWGQQGNEHYEHVKKWIPKASEQIASTLRKVGWKSAGGPSNAYSFAVTAKVPVWEVVSNLPRISESVRKCIEIATFQG